MHVLTEEQERFYAEQGYLLVSGLIPAEIETEAEAAMWRAIGAQPDEPASWAAIAPGHTVFEEPKLTACYTPQILAAAARLSDDDPATFQPPKRAYTINVFPQPGEWRWPRPHIDHAIREHGHKTFPRAFRIASMLFLSDVPPHGGGTIVWPGSHRKLEALAKSDPDHYELMWTLNQEMEKAGIGEPLELTPKHGDILFYHCLCAHSGSLNVSSRPRLAMNMKW
jgi:hypothetical protein